MCQIEKVAVRRNNVKISRILTLTLHKIAHNVQSGRVDDAAIATCHKMSGLRKDGSFSKKEERKNSLLFQY